MAVLPTPVLHSSSPRHTLFLRLFLTLMIAVACSVCMKVLADNPGTPTIYSEDYHDDNDQDFSDENVLNDLQPNAFSELQIQELSTGSDDSSPSAGISIELIEPSESTSFGVNQTIISDGPDASTNPSSVVISEEHTSFSIESPSSSSFLDRESSSSFETTVTAGDKPVVYQTRATTEAVTLPEQVVIEAPVVKFKVRTEVDKKTKRENTIIELEENRLQLDEQGKRGVLIDASALPASYQSEAILQLSLRYRRHCDVDSNNIIADALPSVASHLVTQESSVKPYSSSLNLYLLQVDLCPQRAGQVFSLYFSNEKNIRSVISKFGSVGFYILASHAAGKFAQTRPGKVGPDGDNGGPMDTFAAALPAGAVFNGIAYFREEVERWNLSGYDSDIASCVTTALLAAALNLGDSKFKSDTSQMFVSNAGRLYSRSAYFGELYSCFKHTIVDRIVYDQWQRSHNVTDPEAEKTSSTITSMLAVLGMYSYDFLNQAELEAMERHEIQTRDGNNKLELARFGNEYRGGVASSAYKGIDTFHDHIFKADDSWSGALERASINLMFYVAAAYIFHYSRPYQRQGAELSEQVLGSRSILAANIMEATTAYAFGQVDKHVSQPAANYLADGLVNLNMTVPDSYLHRATKVAVRFAINAGVAYKAIDLINNAGESFKESRYGQQGSALDKGNTHFFVDVITGTTTNGVVLPLVLSLDEDVFTPISDGTSYFLCSPKGWGIGCPTRELQLGIVVDQSGTLAVTHELKTVISD